jgi:Flp pilus assembly protein TadD
VFEQGKGVDADLRRHDGAVPTSIVSAGRQTGPRQAMTAADFYRSILRGSPELAAVRADLAATLLAEGDFEAAVAESSAALAGDSSLVQAWIVRATALKVLCCFEEAAKDFERAAALAPERVMVLVNLGNTYAEIARLGDAERVLRQAVTIAPGSKEALVSLGSVLIRLDRLVEAEAPCRAALTLDPGLVAAHQNLSGVLARSDPDVARLHRDAAYRRQQVFIERAPRPKRTVLVLAAAEAANVPLGDLIPRATTSVIRWYVQYATGDPDPVLAHADVVFNAIGDADLAPELPPPVERFLDGRRVLNPPATVALTRRNDLPRLLAGIPGVVVPAVTLHEGGNPLGFAGPILVRPIGSHGGEGLRRYDEAEGLAGLPPGARYVTQFVDYLSADGWYRKYRVIFVDGRPYPYHLAISRHWLVHYWTSGMEQDAHRRDEERRFLANPGEAIGTVAIAALGAIGARLGLDYAGIDFGLLPDGRLLVFEANATMLVHAERDPCFAYRNPAVQAIRSAFEAMLDRHGPVNVSPQPGLDSGRQPV